MSMKLRHTRWAMALAVAVALAMPGMIYADHPLEPFPAASASFADAVAAGGSLTVSVTGLPADRAREAIRDWNAATGRELFVLSDVSGPDIRIAPGPRNAAAPSDPCLISLKNNATITIRHELGHCLGLADHLAPTCEAESYGGVMSYCSDAMRIDADDIAALRRLGYPVACTITTQPEGPVTVVVTQGACSLSEVLSRTGSDIVWTLVNGRWEWGPRGALDDLTGSWALYAVAGV